MSNTVRILVYGGAALWKDNSAFEFASKYANILRVYILLSYLEFAIGNLDTLPYLFAAGGRYLFGRNLWISLFFAIYIWIYPIALLINRAIFYKKIKDYFELNI